MPRAMPRHYAAITPCHDAITLSLRFSLFDAAMLIFFQLAAMR